MFSLYSLMWQPLKYALYMSKVVRKETLHKYISLGRKSDMEIWIPVTSIDREVSRRCQALNLDRYSYWEAIEELLRRQKLSRSIHQVSRGVKLSVCNCREVSSNCRAICPALMNNFFSLVSWFNLHGFNTKLEQRVSWSIKHILNLLKYK